MVIGDFSHWRITLPQTEAKVADALTRAKNAGLVACFWKCTDGTTVVDNTYLWAQKHCHALGILFGAFHFVESGNPDAQRAWFVKNANIDGNIVLALDYEINALPDVEAMARGLHQQFGPFPLLYTSRTKIVEQIGTRSTYLSNCDLWVASYLPSPEIPPQWTDYTFWQYTNGQNGPQPHSVDGFGPCDLNIFNPKRIDVVDWWRANTVSEATNIPILDIVTTVATTDIPTFTPEGLFRGMITAGSKITVMEGDDHVKTFAGTPCRESPDDYFVPIANAPLGTNPAPVPSPVPTTVSRYVNYPTGTGLNIRALPSATSAKIGGTNNGDIVTVVLPPVSGYDAVATVNGAASKGWILDSGLSTTAPH